MNLKPAEIRDMSAIEREKKLEDLQNELFKLRSSNAMGGTMNDPTQIRQLRRNIARILTIMHENNEI